MEWVYAQSENMIKESSCVNEKGDESILKCLYSLNSTLLLSLPSSIKQDNLESFSPCIDGGYSNK